MNWLVTIVKKAARLVFQILYAAVNAVYKTITRTALYILTTFLIAHFGANSNALRTNLMQVLDETLPGSFDCDVIQFGPLPWKVTLLNTNIKDPEGTSVIKVDRVTTAIDPLALWGWAIKKSVRGGLQPFELRFTEAKIHGADVLVDVRQNGWVGIAEAFDDDEEESEDPGPRVEINDIIIGSNSRVRVIVESSDIDVTGEDLNIIDSKVTIVDDVVRVLSPNFKSGRGRYLMGGLGPPGKQRMDLPWTNLEALNALWNDGKLVIGDATLLVSQSPTSYRGAIDTSGPFTQFNFDSEINVDVDDPHLLPYQNGIVRAGGLVSVEMRGDTKHGVELKADIQSPKVVVAGIDLGPVTLTGALGPETVRKHRIGTRIEFEPFSIATLGGVLHMDRVLFWPSGIGENGPWAEVGLTLDSVALPQVWDLGITPKEMEAPELLHGLFSSKLNLAGGKVGTEWVTTADIDSTLEGHASAKPRPLDGHSGLQGSVSMVYDKDKMLISSPHLYVWSDSDELKLDGETDLLKGTMALNTTLSLSVGKLLRGLNVQDISGQLQLENGRVTGTFGSPNLEGNLTATNGAFNSVRVRRFTAKANLLDGALSLSNMKIASNMSRIRGNAQLTLWDNDISQFSSTLPLTLTNLTMSDFELDQLKLKDVSGTVTGHTRKLTMNLGTKTLDLDGNLSLKTSKLIAMGERFNKLTADVAIKKNKYTVSKLIAVTSQGASLKGQGNWHNRTGVLNAKLSARAVDLSRLNVIRKTKLPIQGQVSQLSLTAKGKLSRLALSGNAKLKGVVYEGVRLGNADLRIAPPKNGAMAISSKRFFKKMKLSDGKLTLDRRGIPERLELALRTRSLNVLNVVPSLRKQFKTLKVRDARLQLDADLKNKRPVRAWVDIPHFGLDLKMKDSPRIRNWGSLSANLNGQSILIERLILNWGGQKLAVCGEVDMRGAIELDVAGGLNLKHLDLREYVNDLRGKLITTDYTTKHAFDQSCLQLALNARAIKVLDNPSGYLAVRNTYNAPTVEGTVALHGVRMSLRGVNKELILDQGAIQLSKAGETLQLSIPKQHRIEGTLGDGIVVLHGDSLLPETTDRTKGSAWLPDSGRFHIQGTSISWASPKEYQITFHPVLVLSFSNLNGKNGTEPDIELGGKVEVTDGEYYKSFDRFAQALGNVGGRTMQRYQASITEAAPALAKLKLNLDVVGNNFKLDSRFGIGAVDLDTGFNVRVGGTLEKLNVKGPLDVTEGIITYEINNKEFEVERGSLDFQGDPAHPYVDIEASADYIVANVGKSTFQQTTDDDDEVRVTIRLTGYLPDVRPTLSSNKATLTQTDLQYLIATGKTKAEFSETGGEFSYGANLTKLVTRILKAPFLEEFSYRPGSDGGELEIISRFAGFKFRVTAKQTGEGNTYNVGFSYKITDRLRLEGSLRDREEDRPQKYTAKLKYSIPLD